MSRENVEVVRRGVDAFNADDTAGFLDVWDPDCEFFTVTGSQMNATPYRGHEGIRRYREESAETWKELRLDTEQILEGEDDDVVVAVGVLKGEGRGSGVRVEQRIGLVYELRGRKVRRCRAYPDPSDALQAVGLPEWAMSQENVELRAIADAVYRAINSGDLEAFLALTAEDVEFTSLVAEAEGTTFRGHGGVRAWWETVRGEFEDARWELIGVREAGDRGVTHFRMGGMLSGVPVEQTMWTAVKLRDGKVAWWATFRTEREALAAVGLRE
jgi:ketosteroid isomerase-like protein